MNWGFKVLLESFHRGIACLSARPLPPLPLPSPLTASREEQQGRLGPIVPIVRFVPHPFSGRSAAAMDSSDR